ncbi:MAG: cytochrome c oxidase subunit II [Cryomorphaceae bacterium]|nr:cytochrome c oxidase subunit II [Cryomorphaceae bacterium]
MMTLLITAVVVLAIIALAQVVRIFEISNSMREQKEEDNRPSHKENDSYGKIGFALGMLFWLFAIWSTFKWGKYLLPVSASNEGLDTDQLMWITMAVIGFVFLITQPILFYFVYRYRGIKGRKATYMEHDNKLEAIWTVIPTIVLAIIITYGIFTWSSIMNPDFEEEPLVVELYAKQFSWQARLAGDDNILGYANVRLIEGANTLGVDPNDLNGLDDIIVSGELHLPVNRPVLFKFRAQDVIHSAYMPHFRAQMNCVPGTVTQFAFTPNKTTAEMRQVPKVINQIDHINSLREEMGEEPYEFDFVLLCNKICGSAHYNMQMKIVVETEEEFNSWLKEQTTFAESL